MAEVDAEGSAVQRYNIWKVAGYIYGEYPVTGAGFGTYALVHGVSAPRVPNLQGNPFGRRDAHSTYLRLLAEVGIPGVALFLAVFVSSWSMVRRALPTIREHYPGIDGLLIAMVCGQVAFLQAGIFGSFAHLPFIYMFTMLICVTVRLYSVPPTRGPAALGNVHEPSPVRRRIPGRRGGLAHALDSSGPVGRGR